MLPANSEDQTALSDSGDQDQTGTAKIQIWQFDKVVLYSSIYFTISNSISGQRKSSSAPRMHWLSYDFILHIYERRSENCLFVLRFYGSVNPVSSAVSLPNHTFTRQAKSSKRLTSIVYILLPETDNCPSWISDRRKHFMINLHERMLPTRRGSNPQAPGHQSTAHPAEPPRPTRSENIRTFHAPVFSRAATYTYYTCTWAKITFYRDHVASTLIRRHFNVVCLLGVLNVEKVHLTTRDVSKIALWIANSIFPDQTPHSVVSDLALHSLHRIACPSTYATYGILYFKAFENV